MTKKNKTIDTFAIRSDKLKGLYAEGFNLDEVIILKDELKKIAKKIKKC